MSKPSGGIRSLHSLSAWGLPTPVVALACIGNVDIQVFSCAGGRLYFIRRLQVYLFIIFHVQPISQGVTLLFFFTEKKKRSKKRKEFAFHLYYTANASHEVLPCYILMSPINLTILQKSCIIKRNQLFNHSIMQNVHRVLHSLHELYALLSNSRI